MDTSNKFMTTAKDSSFQTSLDILQDLQTFINGTIAQAGHILEDEYKYAENLTLGDLENAGTLIAEPIQTYLLEEVKVQSLFNELEKLINNLSDTSSTLHNMNISRNFLLNNGENLNSQLKNVTDMLDSINTTCTGCVPSNYGLTSNIDYTQLPEFDDQIHGAERAEANITNIYNQGVAALDQIAQTINDVAKDPITDVENILLETSNNIANVYTTIDDRLSAISDEMGEYENRIHDRFDVADDYLLYRDYTMLGLILLCFLIFGIFTIGLILGSIVSKDIDPRERSSAANFCGNFLMLQ
ncbi:uncharacterized protein [Amphiura filiformis]|uniref:uncharacterized protein n=1 Tax=Amphiura filiformis TaxID=82378 RepID=UPI003B2183C7